MIPRTALKPKHFAVLALAALAACSETPTDPMVSADMLTASFNDNAQHKVYTSGATVTTWDAILPTSADPNWPTTVCTLVPGVGPNANWLNPHPSFVTTGHPWAGLYFSAPWINSWSGNTSVGPDGHNWTKYRTAVSGNGSFVIKLLADNCSWVYLDGILVGRQPAGHNADNTQYGLTLNGTHTLEFIIFDGGGAAGGKFILETTTAPPPPLNPDLDGDGHPNTSDKFPLDPTEWADTDGDGVGDNKDKFPNDPTEQSDTDGDGTGDKADKFPTDPAEQKDSDSDGVGDNGDNCPLVANADQLDTDGDGAGDACDPTPRGDSDGDGRGDDEDNCLRDPNPGQEDLDGDGVGDACDPDIDGDGTPNTSDAFPTDPAETTDSDGDGVGNNADAFPLDPSETADGDGDGKGNNADNCPAAFNPSQADQDNDRVGDACDPDIDGDGVLNGPDAFPTNPAESADSDGDGVGNNGDAFPNNPAETVDSDGDGVGNNGDNCRLASNASQADQDNDGVGDACDPDIDGDGRPNGSDAFPTNPAEWTDSDGDGVGNNADAFDNSNTGPALMVGACNPGVGNWRISGGTWANDQIAAASASAPNHGAFVSAVSALSNSWKKAGLITGRQHGAIVSCAARTK